MAAAGFMVMGTFGISVQQTTGAIAGPARDGPAPLLIAEKEMKHYR
jgi:glycerol uptake facilitator-like aquaporin